MEKTKNMPLWVFFAFSSIETRKMALILTWCCIIFSVYCIPWVTFTDNTLVETIFLIDDWSWIAMMVPMCLWYGLSLRWVDKNSAWPSS